MYILYIHFTKVNLFYNIVWFFTIETRNKANIKLMGLIL